MEDKQLVFSVVEAPVKLRPDYAIFHKPVCLFGQAGFVILVSPVIERKEKWSQKGKKRLFTEFAPESALPTLQVYQVKKRLF